MKLIVDTNILFSFFKSNSFIRDVIIKNYFEIFSPIKSKQELLKYKNLIMSKSNIDEVGFDLILYSLNKHIKFVLKKDYCYFFNEALIISKNFF